jgi:hypothetical protein
MALTLHEVEAFRAGSHFKKIKNRGILHWVKRVYLMVSKII